MYLQESDGVIDHHQWLNNYFATGLDFSLSKLTLLLLVFQMKQSRFLCAAPSAYVAGMCCPSQCYRNCFFLLLLSSASISKPSLQHIARQSSRSCHYQQRPADRWRSSWLCGRRSGDMGFTSWSCKLAQSFTVWLHDVIILQRVCDRTRSRRFIFLFWFCFLKMDISKWLQLVTTQCGDVWPRLGRKG